jgi:hypothetical protein
MLEKIENDEIDRSIEIDEDEAKVSEAEEVFI